MVTIPNVDAVASGGPREDTQLQPVNFHGAPNWSNSPQFVPGFTSVNARACRSTGYLCDIPHDQIRNLADQAQRDPSSAWPAFQKMMDKLPKAERQAAAIEFIRSLSKNEQLFDLVGNPNEDAQKIVDSLSKSLPPHGDDSRWWKHSVDVARNMLDVAIATKNLKSDASFQGLDKSLQTAFLQALNKHPDDIIFSEKLAELPKDDVFIKSMTPEQQRRAIDFMSELAEGVYYLDAGDHRGSLLTDVREMVTSEHYRHATADEQNKIKDRYISVLNRSARGPAW